MGYLSFPGPGTPEQRSRRPKPAAPSLAAQMHCWGNSSPRFLRQSCRKEMLVPRGRPWAWAWPEIQSPVPFRLGRARQPVSTKTPPQSSGSPQIQREPEGPGLGTPEPWVLWASFPPRGLGVVSALRRAWGPPAHTSLLHLSPPSSSGHPVLSFLCCCVHTQPSPSQASSHFIDDPNSNSRPGGAP